MFFKRRKHKLPRFPDSVIPAFRQLCEVQTEEEVQKLLPEVDKCLAAFEELADKHQNMNLPMAREIADRCRYLLSSYHEFDPKGQALVMGAVRYFAIAEDPLSEVNFASGFVDDARIVNHVLEELGIEDRYIDLR